MHGLEAARGTVPLQLDVRRSPSNLVESQALVEACSPVQVKCLQYHRKPQLIGIGQSVHEDSSSDPLTLVGGVDVNFMDLDVGLMVFPAKVSARFPAALNDLETLWIPPVVEETVLHGLVPCSELPHDHVANRAVVYGARCERVGGHRGAQRDLFVD